MTAPYHDFAVVQFKHVSPKEKKLRASSMLCQSVGQRTYFLSFSDFLVHEGGSSYYCLSGYVADKDAFYCGNIPEKLYKSRTGKYCYVEISRDVVDLSVDSFGQEVLYYSDSYDHVIVSNRLHLVALLMRKMGEGLTLNFPVLARKLFYNVYNENSYTNQIDQTLVYEIRKLPVGKKLILADGKPRIYDEPLYEIMQSGPAGGTTYRKLLRDGVEELRSTLREVCRFDEFAKIIIPVSGGKDSRLILSALLSGDVNLDNIYARTYKTKSELDDKIAIKIQRDLCIKKYVPAADDYYKVGISIDNLMRIYTSYFAGEYTLLNAGGASSIGMNRSIVNLLGTSSNVLRCGAAGTLSKYLPIIQMSHADFVRKFHDKFGLGSLLGRKVADLAREDLASFYAKLPGVALADKLEYSHANAGSRYHGGKASIFHSWNDSPSLNVMLTPSLYSAAKALSIADRVDGRIFFDFIIEAKPELAVYPYDKPFSYAERVAAQLKINVCNIPRNYDVRSYYEIEKNYNHAFLPVENEGFANDRILDHLSRKYDSLFTELVDHFPELEMLKANRFQDYMKRSFARDGEYSKRAVLTLMAVKELLCP